MDEDIKKFLQGPNEKQPNLFVKRLCKCECTPHDEVQTDTITQKPDDDTDREICVSEDECSETSDDASDHEVITSGGYY